MNIKYILLLWSVATIEFHIVAAQESNDTRNILPIKNNSVYFLDNDGNPMLRYMDDVSTEANDENEDSNRQDITFYLFTKQNQNKSYQLFVDDIQQIKNSPFNPKYNTKMIIHGFANSLQSNFVQKLKSAYMKESTSGLNIIVIDWGNLAQSPWYSYAFINVITVGKFAAELIDKLVNEMHLNLKGLHIIGHSLGAHVAGIIGKNLQSSGQISRITGLDPALPGFSKNDTKWILQSTDAEFVDVIHTSAGKLGFLDPLGHIDFYPNGGQSQPGCVSIIGVACSHTRSWQLYVESVLNTKAFPTKECENLKQAETGNCDSYRGDTPNMGEGAYFDDTFESTLFYTKTNSQSPFAINGTN